MDETNKLSLKRVELSLTKFNEVAIPHHLDLLRQHRMNILKYEEAGEYRRVRAEQTNARRVASQLRALLGELDGLRRQLRPADLPLFDSRTQRARDLTLRAIIDYLGTIESSCRSLVQPETSPLSVNRVEQCAAASAVSTESVGVVAHVAPGSLPEQLQLQVDEQSISLEEREAVLLGWSELQREVKALHDTWQIVHESALQQKEQVVAVADSVEIAADNVEVARNHLSGAERLRVVSWGAGGAALGAAVGGPVGLVLGAKAGAAALLAGSMLGYFSAKLLGKKRQEQLDTETKDKNE